MAADDATASNIVLRWKMPNVRREHEHETKCVWRFVEGARATRGKQEAGDLSHGDVENATLACHLNNVWPMFLFSKQQTADSVMMLL